MTSRGAAALIAVFVCLLIAAPAFGQSTSTIAGTVTDPTGAVIPGVNVSVVNTDTNFTSTAQTNSQGIYRIPALQPGTYRVSFESPGFRRLTRVTDVQVGETLPVNGTLEVGEVTESIEVSGRPQLLETETSATGSVVEGQLVYDLPIYQRWAASTFQMVPGMQQSGGAWGGGLGGYRIAGARSTAIGYFEDGVQAQDVQSGTSQLNPVLNSIAEIKVLTTTLPAEYGHSAGGVISMVKKSGTNQFHGVASMFGRSRRMQHRRFADRCRAEQTDQGCTPYGALFLQPDINLNGPLYIPKLYDGRNRTFFSVGWQFLVEKKSLDGLTTVPTEEMKNGILTYNGNPDPIYDPFSTMQDANGDWSRQLIPGNIIPSNMINPVARNIIEIDPWNTATLSPGYNQSGPSNNYQYVEDARVFFEDYTGRLDHQFSPSVKVYGSYSHNDRWSPNRPRQIKKDELSQKFDAGGAWSPSVVRNISIGNTWVVSPTMVNDARFGYYRNHSNRIVYGYGENMAALVGIPNVSAELLPGMGNQYGMDGRNGPNDALQENFTFRNDFSVVRGTHAFKMGYEMIRFQVDNTSISRPSGDFDLGGTNGINANGGSIPNTGNDWASFLLGAVTQATFNEELAPWEPVSSIHSFYIQDDWKVKRSLTLNIGLRYSNESPYSAENQTNWLPTITDPLTGNMGGFTHAPGNLYARDNNNLQPRIGLAWNFADRWVFRGGFTVNTIDIKFPQGREHLEEYVAQANLQGAPGDPTPIFNISDGPPSFEYNVLGDGTAPFLGTNYSQRGGEWVDENLKNPYMLNWNASIQHELTNSLLVELSYQGTGGNSLVERWQYNMFPVDFGAGNPALQEEARTAFQNFRPYTHFGNIRLRSNTGHSTYHGGTIKLEKRLSRGVTFTTFYTWAKSITSQDSDNSGGGVDPLNNRALEKARAGWDRNHRISFAGSYDLPFGQGRRWMNSNRAMDLVLGGWEISAVATYDTGAPYTPNFTRSPNVYYNTTVSAQRADLVGTVPSVVDDWFGLMRRSGDRFNGDLIAPVLCCEDALGYPDSYTTGTAGRNIIDGLPLRQTALSGQKNFRIVERLTAQLRLDFQNPFKRRNFGNPRATYDPTRPFRFGKTTSDTTTASWGGQTLMNLTFALIW